MNLLLTSAGFKVPAVARQALDLLPKPPNELKLAHIVTAFQVTSDTGFVDRDRIAMKDLGFNVTDLLLEDMDAENVFEILNQYDIIYVQGGNGFYLLKHAKRIGLEKAIRKILKDKNKWYVGVSAGTYIACPTIEMHNWKSIKDQHGLESLTAMNLVPFLVVVHYGREKYRSVLAEHIPKASHPVKILTDDQALLIVDDKVTLIGDGPEILASSITLK